MPTSYTSLLGLALPVTGELAGQWGTTVNDYITQYVDSSVAGTQTISGTQTAVTLSVTNGSSLVTAGSGSTGSAQFQIINCTGNPAGLLTITAPASSRQYIIINATSTSQSVKIVGTGPTTGVTILSGEKAHVAWNGSDFVKIATQSGNGDFVTVDTTNLEVTNIKAKDGTAAASIADSTGVISITSNPVLSGGTANGVLYLDGSKAATSGSALTFDGTNFKTTGIVAGNSAQFTGANAPSTGAGIELLYTGTVAKVQAYSRTGSVYLPLTIEGSYIPFNISGAECMRLDSSGNLGLGVTPSGWTAGRTAIQISGSSTAVYFAGATTNTIFSNNNYYNAGDKFTTASGYAQQYQQQSSGVHAWFTSTTASTGAGNGVTFTQAMTLDASGNLLVGTTTATSALTVERGANNATNGLSLVNNNGSDGNGSAVSFYGAFGAPFATTQLLSRITGFVSDPNGTKQGILAFSTGTGGSVTERARITSGGNLLVGGTTSSGAEFRGDFFSGSATSPIAINVGRTGVDTLIGTAGATNNFVTGTAQGDSVIRSATNLWLGSNGASNILFYTSGATERARITSTGNVAIGNTAGPQGRVGIWGSNAGSIELSLDSSPTYGEIQTYSSSPLYLNRQGNNVISNSGGGNLLVGTTTAGAGIGFDVKLAVDAGSGETSIFKTSSSGAYPSRMWNSATTGDNAFSGFLTEGGSGTLRGSITYNRAVGLVAYNTTSDYRAKDIIGPVQNVGAMIDALKVYEGVMKGATQARPMMVAHEAQAVVPFCVSGVKDEINEDGSPKYQQMDHASLVPLLIAEIQSLRARVAQLESKGV